MKTIFQRRRTMAAMGFLTCAADGARADKCFELPQCLSE